MPDARRPEETDVLGGLALAVLAVPGVARLEPTLASAGPRILWSSRASDGIRLLTRAGLTEVDIDLAVRTGQPARRTVAEVQEAVGRTLATFGMTVGTVTVNVLEITDPGDAGAGEIRD